MAKYGAHVWALPKACLCLLPNEQILCASQAICMAFSATTSPGRSASNLRHLRAVSNAGDSTDSTSGGGGKTPLKKIRVKVNWDDYLSIIHDYTCSQRNGRIKSMFQSPPPTRRAFFLDLTDLTLNLAVLKVGESRELSNVNKP